VSADIHVIEHVTEEGMELLVHASFIALSLACVLACLSAVTRLYRRKLITGCLAVRSRYVPAASDEPTIHRTRQLSGGRRLSGWREAIYTVRLYQICKAATAAAAARVAAASAGWRGAPGQPTAPVEPLAPDTGEGGAWGRGPSTKRPSQTEGESRTRPSWRL
tara:strand:- start:3582 stop:4070 length:489 start_codon:yes stop_codon:yes gene_type:complete